MKTPQQRKASFANIADSLFKLVPVLGSDQIGEVSAAAAAITRILSSEGLDWHDVAGQLAGSEASASADWLKNPAWTFQFSRRPPLRRAAPPQITPHEAHLREETRQHWATINPDMHLIWPDDVPAQ